MFGRPAGWLRRPWRLLAVAAALGVSLLAAVLAVAFVRAPPAATLPGRVAAYERAHGVRPVALDRIPPVLRQAVVATEDERFYDHQGVDLLALLRAVPYDVSHWSLAQGASTITEQLAKLMFLHGRDHSPLGKATEVALGFRVGHRFSHETVLDDYLNVVYLGEGQYGVANAAAFYFGRDVERLDLAQASLLAGLVQAPSLYDPLRDPQQARARQAEVLQAMVRNGYITAGEAAAAASRPLLLRSGRALPPLTGVSFAVPAPFDFDALGLGALMLAGALAAFVAARHVTLRPPGRALLRLAAAALFVAGILAAARSVQVV